ncbi:unnamed protein product [Haemonchus placei]|uniref:Ovule protein n=1 Tax=Haemonchus placei TaxID=6290 RepID=A0A0N4WQ47_HAEPC|nr:unnamed protein product [Haemonchus placei]
MGLWLSNVSTTGSQKDDRQWNSKLFFHPESPPLPHCRTEPSRPFLHVGIDLVGPFQVVNEGNGETKRWIPLSTCMVTRAVHLEIVNDLIKLI